MKRARSKKALPQNEQKKHDISGCVEQIQHLVRDAESGRLFPGAWEDLDFFVDRLCRLLRDAYSKEIEEEPIYAPYGGIMGVFTNRAQIKLAVIQRIIYADDYALTNDDLFDLLSRNRVPKPEVHGFKVFNWMVSLLSVLEVDTSTADASSPVVRLFNYSVPCSSKVRVRERVEVSEADLKRFALRIIKKNATLQSLAFEAYRMQCAKLGIRCPNDDNLKKYLHGYLDAKETTGGILGMMDAFWSESGSVSKPGLKETTKKT